MGGSEIGCHSISYFPACDTLPECDDLAGHVGAWDEGSGEPGGVRSAEGKGEKDSLLDEVPTEDDVGVSVLAGVRRLQAR